MTLPTLYEASFSTPLGTMVAISDEQALYVLEFSDGCHAEKFGAEKRWTAPLRSIERELALYFEGKLQTFKTPLQLEGTPFQLQVWLLKHESRKTVG